MRGLLEQLKSDRRGFTIIEGLVALFIIGLIAAAGTSMVHTFAKRQKATNTNLAVLKFRTSIIALLQSSDTLAKMGEMNGITCLKTRQSCGVTSTPFAPLKVTNHAGVFLTEDSSTPAAQAFGFGVDGETCTTFPSGRCPFRYEVEWRALCEDVASCLAPRFQVRGTLKTIPNGDSPFNTKKFSFITYLGQIVGSYEQNCTSLGGSYVSGPPSSCLLGYADDCPVDPVTGAKWVLTGFDRINKTKSCRPAVWDLACPSGQVLLGVNPDGTPLCKAMSTTTQVCAAPGGLCPFECQANPLLPQCSTPVTPGNMGTDGGCGGADGCM